MDNIFVSVNEVCVQKDEKDLFFVSVGSQSLTGVTLEQVSYMSRALDGLLTAACGEEE